MRKIFALWMILWALVLPRESLALQSATLLASAARTSSGSGSTVTLNQYEGEERARCVLDVTAASGTTPTLNATIRSVVNGVTFVVGTFAQKTAVAQETILVEVPGRVLDVNYTIGGTTPSFTFSVQCVVVG